MSVDKNTVKRVARLARIAVTDAEAEALTGELNGILGFVEQLNEVDVTGVEPMTAVVAMKMKQREDMVTDGGIADKVLANAPARRGGLLRRAQGGGMSASPRAGPRRASRSRLKRRCRTRFAR